MATTVDFKDYIEDQVSVLGYVSFKKMFGEYGIFYKEKMVGVLADNKLFIKPTDEGKAMLEHVVMEKFYEQGKPYLLIEDTDDRDLIRKLILKTYDVLPANIEKKRKKKD
ncbi:MAG TPA: TfoX/Sxy family protein [Acholeplasmataceae bacterium]|nr:TfoX/Sxy family protein [Acholeplasmataceae bacterium]